jgi:hypothetical protein
MKIAHYDGLTDTFTEIELTGEEKQKMESDIAQFSQEKAERESKIAERELTKAALLERLGITADEAALLLG